MAYTKIGQVTKIIQSWFETPKIGIHCQKQLWNKLQMKPSIWGNWDFETAEPFLFYHLAIKKNPVWTRTKEFCEKMHKSCQIRRNCFYYTSVFRNMFQHRVKMQLDPLKNLLAFLTCSQILLIPLSMMANVASLQKWAKNPGAQPLPKTHHMVYSTTTHYVTPQMQIAWRRLKTCHFGWAKCFDLRLCTVCGGW
jgi:hypothetical protein